MAIRTHRLLNQFLWTALCLFGFLGLFAQSAFAQCATATSGSIMIADYGLPYTAEYSNISNGTTSGTGYGLDTRYLNDCDIGENHGFVGRYGTNPTFNPPGIITFTFKDGVYHIDEFDLYNNVHFGGGGGVTSYQLDFYDSSNHPLGNPIVVNGVDIGIEGTTQLTEIQSQIKEINRECVSKVVMTINSGNFGTNGGTANPVEIREAVFKGHACTSATLGDPCCPPFNSKTLGDMLYYQGTGTTASPYNIIVVPSFSFRTVIQKYIDYLHSMSPDTRDIVFVWSIRDQGTGVKPIGYPNWPDIPKNGCPNVYSPIVPDSNGAKKYYNSWTATGVVGVGTIGGDGFVTNGVIKQFSSTTLQPDHWYTIWAGAYLNDPIEYFDTAKCAMNCVTVRWQKGKPTPEIAVFDNGHAKMVPLGPPPRRGKG